MLAAGEETASVGASGHARLLAPHGGGGGRRGFGGVAAKAAQLGFGLALGEDRGGEGRTRGAQLTVILLIRQKSNYVHFLDTFILFRKENQCGGQCFGSVFIEPGSGQKSQSGSRQIFLTD